MEYELSGAEVRKLMRVGRVTIRGLAQKWSITQRYVREARRNGVSGLRAEEVYNWCVGKWPVHVPVLFIAERLALRYLAKGA